MKRYIILLFTLVCTLFASAQTERTYIRRGNRSMRGNDYQKAIVAYKKALEADSISSLARYNLGLAWSKDMKPDSAKVEYQKALEHETNPKYRAQIYHNWAHLFQCASLGEMPEGRKDTLLRAAVDLYRHSLRNDPHNDQTRYNYLLCLRQLKNQPPQDDDQNNQDQQKDENGQNKQNEPDKNKDNQDKKQDQNKENEQQQNQQDKQEQQKPNINKETAEQLLEAAMREEKETQDKVQTRRASRKRLQKQW